MQRKSLYLGLKAKPGTVHYPVIRTERLPYFVPVDLWPNITHMIFTSQEAVRYWKGPFDKALIAIGTATQAALQERGYTALIPQEATQEGIAALLPSLQGVFFWPRSLLSRPFLVSFCSRRGIDLHTLPIYTTCFQALQPIPNLEEFEEVIFTSPSTVEGFMRIFGKLPEDKCLTAIGPITQSALALHRYRQGFDFYQ